MPTLWCSTWYSALFSMLLKPSVPVSSLFLSDVAVEPISEPEIMQALRKVCKLLARKQRQVTELIKVISRPPSRAGN
ncbi:hypothetical protein [Erwinia rhapontici]|uniref:hypothetical protein n=1 Tax=Erwinia rhapontici TaxID=55212 RepID=UPI00105BF259